MKKPLNLSVIGLFVIVAVFPQIVLGSEQSCDGDECMKLMGIGGGGSVLPAANEVVREKSIHGKPKPMSTNSNIDRVRTVQAHPVEVSKKARESGNLPEYMAERAVPSGELGDIKSPLIAPHDVVVGLDALRVGDRIPIRIEQAITASPSVPTPIRAEVLGGRAARSILIGEAKLDRELKRVLIDFGKIRVNPGSEVYELKAQVLSPSGEVGLVGEYHSEDGKFFVAAAFAQFMSVFTDSQINRSQTAFGTYVQEPSLANSAKAGAAGALSQTANRMAERANTAPEYTSTEGEQFVSAIIIDEPTRKF